MAVDRILNGISYVVRSEVATPPMVPKVEIIANPIGPQLQAPADAPMIEPTKLPPIRFDLFCRVLILYTFIGITKPDRKDTLRIRTNPINRSYGT
jgi:hypothetical protein